VLHTLKGTTILSGIKRRLHNRKLLEAVHMVWGYWVQ